MIRNVLLSSAALIAVSGAAFAADLPSNRAPVAPPPIPVFSWTGVYVGGQVGYGFGNNTANGLGVSAYSKPAGVIGGGFVGYNFQPVVGNVVLGVEGDVSGTSERATGLGGLYTTKSPVQGSIRARAGFAVDRALFYATGGAAFASFNDNYFTGDSTSTSRVGWTVGGGVQYALTNEWSVRAEYRYSDFGTYTDTLPLAGGVGISQRQTENQVLVGVAYKFGAPVAPVVARY